MSGDDDANKTVDTALERGPERGAPTVVRPGLRLATAIWALGGVVVGLALAFGAVPLMGGHWGPPAAQTPKPLAVPPSTEAPTQPAQEPPSVAPQGPAPTGETAPAPADGTAVQPLDPFGGTALPGKLPTVVGPILPEAVRPPTATKAPDVVPNAPAPKRATSGADLETVAHETNDVEAAKREIAAFVKKRGGTVRSVAGGMMVLVPRDQAPGVMAVLSKHGTVTSQESWSGTPSERQNRLVADLEQQRGALMKKRSELLVKYLEDASPVKQVEEDIKTVERRIEELQIEPAAQHMAAVKVTFTVPR